MSLVECEYESEASPERDRSLVQGGRELGRAVVVERRADERVIPAGAYRDDPDEPFDVVLLERRRRVRDRPRTGSGRARARCSGGRPSRYSGSRGSASEAFSGNSTVGHQVRQNPHLVADGVERRPSGDERSDVAHLPVDGDPGQAPLAVRVLEMNLLVLVPRGLEHAAHQVLLVMLEDSAQRGREILRASRTMRACASRPSTTAPGPRARRSSG